MKMEPKKKENKKQFVPLSSIGIFMCTTIDTLTKSNIWLGLVSKRSVYSRTSTFAIWGLRIPVENRYEICLKTKAFKSARKIVLKWVLSLAQEEWTRSSNSVRVPSTLFNIVEVPDWSRRKTPWRSSSRFSSFVCRHIGNRHINLHLCTSWGEESHND